MDTPPPTESSPKKSSSPEAHDDKLMRLKVKSETVDVGLARLVSKSFALRCLRVRWPSARIQVIKHPVQALIDGYKLKEHPDFEVWQVHAGGKGVEVCGPREALPFTAVREAYRCLLQFNVTFEPIKGGVSFGAEPIPQPVPQAPPEKVALVAADAPPAEIEAALRAVVEP